MMSSKLSYILMTLYVVVILKSEAFLSTNSVSSYKSTLNNANFNIVNNYLYKKCEYKMISIAEKSENDKKYYGRSIFKNPIPDLIKPITDSVSKVKQFFQTELPVIKYLWPSDSLRLRIYLVLSLIFMFVGKFFVVKLPFLLQRVIDSASKTAGLGHDAASLLSSGNIILLYGVSRALSVVCSEIKTCLFAHVSQNVLRKFAGQIFSHLHKLDSDYHWQTASGTISVAYVRAIRGFATMMFQIIFTVAPTILELVLVSNVLFKRCGPLFAGINLSAFVLYTLFTVWITEWRVGLRQELVDVDNARNGFFIDSILNHEVVKLFTNEQMEYERFDKYLQSIQTLNIKSTYSIAALNLGQTLLFCLGLTANLVLALRRVAVGTMSVGDLVAVNGLLLQLSVPFNYIGFTYQEMRQAYVDMGYMRNVLVGAKSAIVESKDAKSINIIAPLQGPSSLEFKNVHFQYGGNDTVKRELLQGVSFKIYPGQSAAIVGPSGSGKSTTLRLITRMLDPCAGDILIDGANTKEVTVESLRQRIAVVPQDTSLFDETIEFNIRYGNLSATDDAIAMAVTRCNLVNTIDRLSDGMNTRVGERGAKLSGGERQKVSIARAMLRDPSLILCDEVTSSVDAFAERDIVNALRQASERRTTVTIAHRLSSIVHCDVIIVLDSGVVVEQGTHDELLNKSPAGLYRKMWEAQNDLQTNKLSKKYFRIQP